jgi:hypothetical protein
LATERFDLGGLGAFAGIAGFAPGAGGCSEIQARDNAMSRSRSGVAAGRIHRRLRWCPFFTPFGSGEPDS